jgi:hypothetical protein
VVLFGFEQRNDLRTAKYLWPFNVLVVSRITYAIEAWGSYVTIEQEGMINKMFKKAKNGASPQNYSRLKI